MQLEDALERFINETSIKIAQRGQKLANQLHKDDLEFEGEDTVFASVPSSNDFDFYEVCLENINSKDRPLIVGICDCAYAESGDICKHQVAVAVAWLKILIPAHKQPIISKAIQTSAIRKAPKPKPEKIAPDKKNEPADLILPFLHIDFRHIQPYSGGYWFNKAPQACHNWQNKFAEILAKKGWEASFPGNKLASVSYLDKDQLLVTCNCGGLATGKLCLHAESLLYYIAQRAASPAYFYRYKDFSKEKAAYLKAHYNLKPDAPEAAAFKFGVDQQGALKLMEKPSFILGVGADSSWDRLTELIGAEEETLIIPSSYATSTKNAGYHTALLFNFNDQYLGFMLEPVLCKEASGKKTFKRLRLEGEHQKNELADLPVPIAEALLPLSREQLLSAIAPPGSYLHYSNNPWGQLTEQQNMIVKRSIRRALEQIRPHMDTFGETYLLPAGEKFVSAHITPATFSPEFPILSFKLSQENNFLKIWAFVQIGGQKHELSSFTPAVYFMRRDTSFYLVQEKDISALQLFSEGVLMAPLSEKARFLEKVAYPLSRQYPVDFGNIVAIQPIEGTQPEGRVYLSEQQDQYLLISPAWLYDGVEVRGSGERPLVEKEDKTYQVYRQKETESVLLDALRQEHPNFARQQNGPYYLSFAEALQGQWFLRFHEHMQAAGIPVLGMKQLHKFRYSFSSPTLNIRAGSGTDWFDLNVELNYGDQVVPLEQLRKAILHNQPYILLDDGSMGILPEEWLKKYSLLMKMGKVKDGVLQVSKFNWTLIDQLHEEINEEALLEELAEKKQKLQQIDQNRMYELPKGIKASLRDYQHAGFQWMCLLDSLGWGGCLADDMGLGKTLQTISLLHYVAAQRPDEVHLVVCPTSLIFNWEAELRKFAPKLSYHIHYGVGRDAKQPVPAKTRVVLTSYGILRSDLEAFRKTTFGYVVLDESHTIKNPASQIAKAVQLLKSRNRLALSGTPLQNNTFDLYAQMHFLNPGMLGNQEFFRTEFAGPIDRGTDPLKAAELKKLIYPFMLRRTKEQVAKDLPDKTESILWCEMDKGQRQIYESFKVHYREKIMEKIAREGLGKSSFYILEGLGKLRQICDSPALVHDPEQLQPYPNQSVKIHELLRELQENTGQHKALVFSQFTGMLQLLGDALAEKELPYLYLDGQTPAAKRRQVVADFQNNPELRIFLISLKAGGVGLNLTAADYVYLIDPWWNPATEQQAIDRTHRIGQQQKVFAYRMICKDSIEEKIVQLQEKKKSLAADLIADETGFIKKLKADDVAFLFG